VQGEAEDHLFGINQAVHCLLLPVAAAEQIHVALLPEVLDQAL
jgi:hypothetical protein